MGAGATTTAEATPAGPPAPLPDGDAPGAADFYWRVSDSPGEAARRDPFSAHVFACILAVSLSEAATRGEPLERALGLGADALAELVARWLPGARACVDLSAEPREASFDDEEEQLRGLLRAHQADASAEAAWLTDMMTRRSLSDTHLWQDLGLLARDELTRLMLQRYPALAARNVENMKWKKFFYRQLCAMEGFTLCTAPSCRECGDFDSCFGEETGESALARIRRDASRTA
ncbi:nitrogen fixation protein NifQ [Methylocella sp.]|uniref:nitrogen fixation protein NifQ n=1 Tax=Methylocella sp. TaxID=1978226 RepID=UPI0037835EFD